MKIVIGYAALRLVLCDGYNLMTNIRGGDCGDTRIPLMEECVREKYTIGSVANKASH